MGMGKSCISVSENKIKFFSWFLGSLFVFNLGLISFGGERVSAAFVPTLSVSLNQVTTLVNGNQVINSTNKTTEIPLNLTVNTNNKTGYTATLNSETDETALVNSDSTNGAKINSISSASILSSFSNNTWGVKVGSSTNFSPIPKSTSPMNIMQATRKTYGSETNGIKIGLKLGDNLESGRYTNKLVFSILTNNYDRIALMTNGPDFNAKLKSLETATNKIERFKKSTAAPAASINVVNIEDENSDYEIKLWLDPTDKTAYYYTEPEKVYLNADSSRMFYSIYYKQEIKKILEIDLSGFDTSKVTNMNSMFAYMSKLTTLNLSHFDTSQVTNMGYMFYNMPALTTLNPSSFDTSKVTNMGYMFSGMSNITTLNLSNFDTSNVTDMYAMFSLRDEDKLKDKLEKIYVNNDFDTTKLTNFSGMFKNRKQLRGGNGSYLADPSVADKTWLRVDRPGVQGYFTRKP